MGRGDGDGETVNETVRGRDVRHVGHTGTALERRHLYTTSTPLRARYHIHSVAFRAGGCLRAKVRGNSVEFSSDSPHPHSVYAPGFGSVRNVRNRATRVPVRSDVYSRFFQCVFIILVFSPPKKKKKHLYTTCTPIIPYGRVTSSNSGYRIETAETTGTGRRQFARVRKEGGEL